MFCGRHAQYLLYVRLRNLHSLKYCRIRTANHPYILLAHSKQERKCKKYLSKNQWERKILALRVAVAHSNSALLTWIPRLFTEFRPRLSHFILRSLRIIDKIKLAIRKRWRTFDWFIFFFRLKLHPSLVWWGIIRNFYWFIFCLRTNLRHFIG